MYKFVIYYQCECGKEFTKVEEVQKDRAECWCGSKAKAVDFEEVGRYNHKPHGRLYDLPSYQSPITGKWIDGRVARRNDLAASGCVEYEDGMKEEQIKRHAREDAELDKKVDEIVEKTIYEMPTEKREQLVTELENSDIEVVRT